MRRSLGAVDYYAFLLIPTLFLAACASVPPPPPGDDAGFAALPPGGFIYLALDVPASRPLTDMLALGGFQGEAVSGLLDMTDSVRAVVFDDHGERRFYLRARGRYPSFQTGLSFIFSPAWKQTSSAQGGRYWRSGENRLSVALNSREALVSDGDPFNAEAGPEVPAALEEMSRGAVLSGWIPHAGDYAARFLRGIFGQFSAGEELPIQVPAERLLFGVYKSAVPAKGPEPFFDLVLRIETPSESHARGLASLMGMLRLFLAGQDSGGPPVGSGSGFPAGALLTAVPVRQGSTLILRAPGLRAGEVALLFNMFSLYSIYN
jgi:hypothetical protein